METAARINLFFMRYHSFSELADIPISPGGFYQRLVSTLSRHVYTEEFFRIFGNKLVAMAEQAYAIRRRDTLGEISRILVSLPFSKQIQATGLYYQALSIDRFESGKLEQAARLLEHTAANVPLRYKIRTIQSLGGNYYYKGDYRTALSLYSDAGRFALRNNLHDPYSTIGTQKMIAVINGIEGNHRDAVAMLENLFPLAHSMRAVYPYVYYDYLNSFAVELGEVGRLEEAQNVSRIALASPYASAYPEWRETFEELRLKAGRASRSSVAIRQYPPPADNLVRLPEAQRGEDYQTSLSNPASRPAKVFYLGEWKNKMNKESDETPHEILTDQQIKSMSREEKLCAIARLIYADDAQEEMLDRFLEVAFQLRSGSKGQS